MFRDLSRTVVQGVLLATAQALDLAIADVEVLCADLVAEGMIERTRMQ